MQTHPIGKTGLSVTPIGFGTAALGGMPDTFGYDVDDATAFATIEAILDGPVNLLDTARNYGHGRSEARIGQVIRARGGLPEGFVLATKLDRDDDTGRFDGDRVRRSAEESLTALGVERFQILHLHDPEHARDLAEITRPGGALDTLFRLKDEGLVQAAGIAMGRLDILAALLPDWPFDIVLNHNRFTLLNRSAQAVYDAAAARGMAVFNAAPFAGGVLAKGSAQHPRVTYQPADAAALAPVQRIEALCAAQGIAPGAAALQFSLNAPQVTTTIVGVSKPERVRQTLDWAAAAIPPAARAALDALPFSLDDPEASRAYRNG